MMSSNKCARLRRYEQCVAERPIVLQNQGKVRANMEVVHWKFSLDHDHGYCVLGILPMYSSLKICCGSRYA